MSRVCSICGKGQTSGNNVSHSKRRTRRTFKANVQKVSFVQDGKEQKGYVFHKGKNPITSEGIFAKFSVSLLFFCKAKQKRRFLSENLQDRHRRHAAFLRS